MHLIKPIVQQLASSFEVKSTVHERFNKEMQQRLSTSVWSGCTSWYRKGHNGKVVSLWPGTMTEFWWRMRSPVWSHYKVVNGEKWTKKRRFQTLARTFGLASLVLALVWARNNQDVLRLLFTRFVVRVSSLNLNNHLKPDHSLRLYKTHKHQWSTHLHWSRHQPVPFCLCNMSSTPCWLFVPHNTIFYTEIFSLYLMLWFCARNREVTGYPCPWKVHRFKNPPLGRPYLEKSNMVSTLASSLGNPKCCFDAGWVPHPHDVIQHSHPAGILGFDPGNLCNVTTVVRPLTTSTNPPQLPRWAQRCYPHLRTLPRRIKSKYLMPPGRAYRLVIWSKIKRQSYYLFVSTNSSNLHTIGWQIIQLSLSSIGHFFCGVSHPMS